MEQINIKSNVEHEKIIDSELQNAFLNCMADSALRDILFCTIDEPKSILQINKENNIPLRTVYRKMQFLIDNKLIKISGVITDAGKKFFLYKSRIRAINIKIDDSNTLYVYVNRNK
ncbi:MAG: ArsR family transcriptional regulator [Nitrosopumilus sp.]|nr:ArsR family transcriptional regulator [Nitrosopumilus sp.]